MQHKGTTLLRLTRDAEIEIDEDSDESLQDIVKEQVKHRRYEPVVRLEFGPEADPSIREMLRARFKLLPVDIYDMYDEVDYTSLFEIAGLPIASLRDRPWTPIAHPALVNEDQDIFAAIQAEHRIMHHPYDSFDA